jgi:hypothetical protein
MKFFGKVEQGDVTSLLSSCVALPETEEKRLMIIRTGREFVGISGCHSDDHEKYYLLGCASV